MIISIDAEKNFYKIQQPFMIQFSSVTQSYPTLWDTMNYSTPGLPVHHQLLEFTQTYDQESVIPSNHLILSCPLLLLPSIFPSITVFSNDSAFSIRWPSIRVSASASVLPINIQDWFPLGWTGWISLKSKRLSGICLQHHSSKASIFWCSAFFIVQLSHSYMTTGKTIALTSWNFVDKVMSLFFNMLSRFVINFLPRSKHLLKFHGCNHHLQWFWSPEK